MQQSFTDLGVPVRITRALAERDIHIPFPIQEQASCAYALAGRDILAKAPTGSGKTLAFAIPIVERLEASDRGPFAVVLVPTRELASQVAGEIEAIAPSGLSVATVYGGVPVHAQAERARRAHVLVATPGRLNDLLERKAVALDGVRILVLDEADRMLDMGFKPQVDRILRHVPRERQTMFFSTTLDASVGEARTDVHDRRRPLRGGTTRHRGERRGRASVRRREGGRQGRDPRRAPARRARAGTRVRADTTRRRPARHEVRRSSRSTPSRFTAT